MFDHPLIFAFPLIVAFAAFSDVFTMTIPNRVSIILVASFFVAAILSGLPLYDILWHCAAGAAVLVVTIAMFARGWLGGGDAKLLAASSLWIGFPHLIDFITHVAVAGGALALFFLAFRRALPFGYCRLPLWVERLHDRSTGIPYGVAIAAGALVVYPMTPAFRALAA